MPTYTPHTEDEISDMLAFLGLASLDQLFEAVPEAIRLVGELAIPRGRPEPDVYARIQQAAARNRPCGKDLVCFAGGGAYDHEVPAAVRALASRSEFVTSYTPYQPEVAQGVLQALFEFQTMVAALTDLEISNASLYDGAAALTEAVNLAASATGRSEVWVSAGVRPTWREVISTFSRGTGHVIREIPLDDGLTCWPSASDEAGHPAPGRSEDHAPGPAALVVSYPNHLGCLEDLSAVRALCDATGALMIAAFDPIASGVLRSPGSWGADIAVGEGQAVGMPLSFGGPYLGLFACSPASVRRMPGRLVGETLDVEGRVAYVTTLRAREQDIRREKASSNVCTNQTLMALTAAIQLAWLGPAGIAEVAIRSARATRHLRDLLLAIDGVEPLAGAPTLYEFSIRTPADPELLVERLADEGFLAGLPLDPYASGGLGEGLLLCATERRTRQEIEAFATAFAKALG